MGTISFGCSFYIIIAHQLKATQLQLLQHAPVTFIGSQSTVLLNCAMLKLALINFAAIIKKLMQFENNCMGATLSSVAAIYNCIIIINGLSMHLYS